MRRLHLGLGLLAALLATGIWLTSVFVRLHEPVSGTLEQAQEAVWEGDWEKASMLTHRVHQDWKNTREFIAAVADHEPLEEMDAMFYRLEAECRLRQADEFAADCAELARLANAMAESQKIVWWNFL